MTKLGILMTAALATAGYAFAADPPAPPPTVAKLYDMQLGVAEKELISLVEAMPEEKFSFAPTQGEFKGVRTFAQQAKHIATTNFEMAAVVLGEKDPVEAGTNENGADSIQTKADIVKYLKDSFAYCHKAELTLTKDNLTDQVDGGDGHKVTRGLYAHIPIWHAFDHYGQMVEYARMNGIVPPASRPQ